MTISKNIRRAVRRHPPEDWRESPAVDGYVLRAPDLKATVMECYFAGYISQAEAEDLIQLYGLARA